MQEPSIGSLWPDRPRGIILAADVSDLSLFVDLVSLASENTVVLAVKIGFSLALRYSLPRVVDVVRERTSLSVIYDHQKAGTDIPGTGELFMSACRDAGIDAVILFPQAGPRTLESWVTQARKFALIPIVGITMTHEAYLASEGGYIDDNAPAAICETSLRIGIKDFVLPGTKPHVVARYSTGPLRHVQNVSILMPGIGSQGGEILAALAAAHPHRRYAIIGSAIYSAPDPKTALSTFARSI